MNPALLGAPWEARREAVTTTLLRSMVSQKKTWPRAFARLVARLAATQTAGGIRTVPGDMLTAEAVEA
jgi:hypothetical protein